MYPVGAWMPHTVHIWPFILVISIHHAHCTSVGIFGSGTAPGLHHSYFTPTPKFCCKLWVAAAKVIMTCCLIPIYVNNCQSIYHGCGPVYLIVRPVPNFCWHIGGVHKGSSSFSNHGEVQFYQVIPLWGYWTCVLKADVFFQYLLFATCYQLKLSPAFLHLVNLTGCTLCLHLLSCTQVGSII